MANRFKNITLLDLAKHTGYSTATISRVINNKGPLRESTVKEVKEAIKKLGYSVSPKRNVYPSNRKRPQTIFFLVPDNRTSVVNLPVSQKIYGGVESRSEMLKNAHGLVKYGDRNSVPEQVLSPNSIVILKNWVASNKVRKSINHLTVVQCLESPTESRFYDSVEPDIQQMAEIMIYDLKRKGIGDLVFLSPSYITPDWELRTSTLIHLAHEGGLKVSQFRLNSDACWKMAHEALQQCSRELGVFINGVHDDVSTIYEELIGGHGRKSDDLSCYCTVHDELLSKYRQPKIRCFDFNFEQIGEAAVDLALWRKENPKAPLRRVLVTPSFYA